MSNLINQTFINDVTSILMSRKQEELTLDFVKRRLRIKGWENLEVINLRDVLKVAGFNLLTTKTQTLVEKNA